MNDPMIDMPDDQANPGQRNWFMIMVLLIAGAAGIGAFFATGHFQQPPPPPPAETPRHRFSADESRRFGQGPGGPGGRGENTARGLDDNHLRRFLNLDDQQAEKVRTADPEFRDDMMSIFQSMRQARSQFIEVLQNEEATDEQILTRLDDVLALNARMERRIVDHLLRIRPHLDAEQARRLMRLTAMHIRSAGMGRGGPPEGRGPGGRERFRDYQRESIPDQPPQ